MLFSVVTPSYLGHYANAATNREEKFCRAIDSLIDQTCDDWELWVVADGCQKTMDILRTRYSEDPRINGTLIDKQKTWHPAVRNVGISRSKGDWIVYLDTDDAFGPEHLSILKLAIEHQKPEKWGYFNSIVFDTDLKQWVEHEANMSKASHCSTSNLVHRRDLNAWWPKGGYLQDWEFAQVLKRYGQGTKLPTPQYFVLHQPRRYDL